MTDRELMQQALEALTTYDGTNGESKRKRVLAALRERLAQPNEFSPDWDAMAVMVAEQQRMATEIERLKDGFNEPVAWVCYGSASDEKHTIDYRQEDIDAIPVGTMLYTAPRQWQGLTDDEREQFRRWAHPDMIEAIELRLQEKNT